MQKELIHFAIKIWKKMESLNMDFGHQKTKTGPTSIETTVFQTFFLYQLRLIKKNEFSPWHLEVDSKFQLHIC